MRFFLSIIMSAVLTCSLIPLKAFADVTLPSTASYVGYVQSGKTYYIRNHLTASYLSAPSGASVGSSLALGTCTPSSDRYKWTLQQIGTTQYFKIVNKQYQHLRDEALCNQTESRFGEIAEKTVLYRGDDNDELPDIQYKNAAWFLEALPGSINIDQGQGFSIDIW